MEGFVFDALWAKENNERFKSGRFKEIKMNVTTVWRINCTGKALKIW